MYRTDLVVESDSAPSRIFGYVRASTLMQVASPQKQHELILAHAKSLWGRNGQSEEIPVAIYGDRVSATKTRWNDRKNRPGLAQMFDVLEPDDHLIIWRLDRLDRSAFGMVHALEFLVNRGVNIHVVQYGAMRIDLDRAMGKTFVMIMAGMAAIWSEQHAQTIKEDFAYRRAHGLGIGRAPLPGHVRKKVAVIGRSTTKNHPDYELVDVWDEEQCRLIREIYQRVSRGEQMLSVATDFYERGEINHAGNLWTNRKLHYGRPTFHITGVARAYWWHVERLAEGLDLWDHPATAAQQKEARWLLGTKRRKGAWKSKK